MPTVRSPLALVPAAALVRDDDHYLDDTPDPLESLYGSPVAAGVINTMVDALGGQEALLAELLVAPDLTHPQQLLVQLVLDPRYMGHSFGWLCAKANLTPGDVFLAFRDALAAKATIISMRQNSGALVPVLNEIIQSAITHEQMCLACRGKKEQTVKVKQKGSQEYHLTTVPCVTCQATGTVIIPADREAQRIVLDLVGLTKKSAQNVINNQQITQVSSSASSYGGGNLSTEAISGGLAQLQQATAQILFGREAIRRPVVDVPPEPEPVTP